MSSKIYSSFYRFFAGFAVLTLLCGCSGSDAATTVSPTHASPAAESSVATDDVVSFVEPEKPQITAGMKNNDAQGAKEAIEYFGKVLTYAMGALDKSVIEHIEIQDDFDDCAPCITARNIIEEAERKNRRYVGLEMIFSLHEEPEETLEGLWMARGKALFPPYKTLDSNGKEVKAFEAEESPEVDFAVQYEKSGWKFVGVLLP